MKTKWIAMLLAGTVAMSMTACGAKESDEAQEEEKESGTEQGTGTAETTDESDENIEITFFHYQEQYQEQYDKLVQLYKEVKPNVDIKVEIIGADYDKILQTRVSTDEVPDIFLSGPYNTNETYSSISYDLQNEEFIQDVTIGSEYWASNGELTAVPINTQVWGIIYNKDIFKKVGITELPETLEELEDVCRRIREAGYTPFAQGYKSDYVRAQLMGFPYSVDENYEEAISQIVNKEKELKDFDFIYKILDGVELIGKYSQENPFDDDFAAAATKVGMGEAAMTTNGDWIVENIMKANPDCNIGLMALPLSNDPDDTKIYTCDAVGLHVSKSSKNLDAVLEFIDWMITSEEGKSWMANDMKSLSPIKGVVPEGSSVLEDALGYMGTGNTGGFATYSYPSNLGNGLNVAIDKFLLGEISKEEAVEEMNAVWSELE